jgi:hypothetical protein
VHPGKCAGKGSDEDQQEMMRFITFFRFSKGWNRCTEDGGSIVNY